MTTHSPLRSETATLVSTISLDSDSGYESDGGLRTSVLLPDIMPRRRTASAVTRNSVVKRPKAKSRPASSSGGSIRSRFTFDQSPIKRLSDIKDPLPSDAFQYASLSDALLLPPKHLRTDSASTDSTLVNTPPRQPSLSLEEVIEDYAIPVPQSEPPVATNPKPNQLGPYRKPSEDPAWKVYEPIKLVTEEHVQPIYKNPNGNIEEMDDEGCFADVSNAISDSESPAEDAGSESVTRPQPLRSETAPAIVLTSPNSDNSQPLVPALPTEETITTQEVKVAPPAGPTRLHSEPAFPSHLEKTTSTPSTSDTTTEPLFEEARPWAGINDLFLEATRVMNSGYSVTKPNPFDSAFLVPAPSRTEEVTTPPTTPIGPVGGLPAVQTTKEEIEEEPEQEVSVEEANDELASTLYDSVQLSTPTSTKSPKSATAAKKAQATTYYDVDGFTPLPHAATKWVFMAFGLVGGAVLSGMLAGRGRL